MNTFDSNSDTNPNFADPLGVEFDAFRLYVGSLNLKEKINYLQFLEINYRSSLSDNYYATFQEFDPILLSIQPVEVVTRIHFVYSDVNKDMKK